MSKKALELQQEHYKHQQQQQQQQHSFKRNINWENFAKNQP
jgi:hypothetical protein